MSNIVRLPVVVPADNLLYSNTGETMEKYWICILRGLMAKEIHNSGFPDITLPTLGTVGRSGVNHDHLH